MVPERLSQTQQSVSVPPAWQQRVQRFSTAWRPESPWQVRHWSGLGPKQCLHALSHGSQISCEVTRWCALSTVICENRSQPSTKMLINTGKTFFLNDVPLVKSSAPPHNVGNRLCLSVCCPSHTSHSPEVWHLLTFTQISYHLPLVLVTGHMKLIKDAHVHTYGQFKVAKMNLRCMGRACKLHTERLGIKPEC